MNEVLGQLKKEERRLESQRNKLLVDSAIIAVVGMVSKRVGEIGMNLLQNKNSLVKRMTGVPLVAIGGAGILASAGMVSSLAGEAGEYFGNSADNKFYREVELYGLERAKEPLVYKYDYLETIGTESNETSNAERWFE